MLCVTLHALKSLQKWFEDDDSSYTKKIYEKVPICRWEVKSSKNLRRDAKKLSVKFGNGNKAVPENHVCPFCFTGEPLPES